MVTHRLLTVGKPRDPCVTGWVEEYLKRLRPWAAWRWEQVAEEPFSDDTRSQALVREGGRLLRRIRPTDWLVVLDVAGESLDSPALSRRLAGWQDQGRVFCVVVGGSLGVSPAVLERSDWRWSLGPITLPHGLAQVVAAEQLYRAATIYHGHPYHKD